MWHLLAIMNTQTLLAALIALGAGSLSAQEAAPATPAAIQNWRDARFGMFVHWGPVSIKGTEIGWSRGEKVPVEEYDKLYQQFNPTEFNAEEWVAAAKGAGMKYLVLTTKHHDGFCLWDTKQTDYNIMHTPFKRDVVKELAAACKKGGIGFGTYYSTCDWHHPDFPLTSPGGKTVREKSDLDAYTAYLKAQVSELLTNYGPLFTLWFDVPQKFDATRGAGIINLARSIQPDIVINNRTGHKGDYDTPEQRIGGFQIDRPWETCMTICQQWAWKPDDKMKSLEQCLHTLIRANGGDGNLLFNVGPMPNGRIEGRQIERLKEMGAWLGKNGGALYGTHGGPWKPSNHLVSTRKGDKVYLHLLMKVANPVKLLAPPVEIKSARLLQGAAIPMQRSDGMLSLEIPDGAWDPIDTIVELTVSGDSMEIAPLSSAGGPSIPGAKATASAVFSSSPEFAADKAIDGDSETRWATPAGTKNCWIQLDLPEPATITGVEIDEVMTTHTSRVKKYELQVKDGGSWTTVHSGGAVGEHAKLTFAPVSTTAIRLNILDASEGPTISEIRLNATARKP